MLRTHCQTSGVSLQEQDPYNNIVRTAFEAMSAVLGGTQSLHTNSFDEAIALPSEISSRIARNTQLILQHETGITNVVDPLAGSYYVESLTKQLADSAWALMEKIENMGGMTKAVEMGWPKQQIEESATRKQAAIDMGDAVVVGVNKYRLEEEAKIETREVDNRAVRAAQIERLEKVKRNRNSDSVVRTLNNLTSVAQSGEGNLLSAAIEAARARATVGEISDAMRKVFGVHTATPQVVHDVHGELYRDDAEYKLLKARLNSYAKSKSAPRMLIAKLGQDGHDRGAKIIASAFGDLGFEIIAGPLFQTPQEVAELGIASNVQIIGVSSLAAGHKTLLPELTRALKANGGGDIIVVCGGVVPRGDYEFLRDAGVSAIFGPGTNVLDAMRSVLDLLEGVRRN